MTKRRFISLLLFLAVTIGAMGQTEMDNDVKSKPKPKRKDRSHFVLKAYYDTPNLKLKDNFVTDLGMGKISGVVSHSRLGFSLYIPLGQYLFLQPEAMFSLTTDWVAASYEGSAWNEFRYGYKHRTGTAMDVPVLFGAKWAPSKMFRAKAYLGPTFNLGWQQKEFQSHFSPYALTLGVGLDLLNFLSVDMGHMLWMRGLTYTQQSKWFVAVGIIM